MLLSHEQKDLVNDWSQHRDLWRCDKGVSS